LRLLDQDARNEEDRSVMKYSQRYQLLFTLAAEEDETRACVADWEIELALQASLNSFLQRVRDVHNVTVTAQWLMSVQPGTPAPLDVDAQDSVVGWFYPEEKLSAFINTAEWYLSSAASTDPMINLITYVPATNHRPTLIRDTSGTAVASNAFAIPQWGGVAIVNPDADTTILTAEMMRPVMAAYVSQLRALLGVRPITLASLETKVNVHVDVSSVGLTAWEQDAMLRTRIIETLVEARQTLASLLRLVAAQGHMVVHDEIAEMVAQSVHHVDASHTALMKHNVTEAFAHSQEAYRLADTAFFDPHMVGMVYFPDEHKYAVYMPLFFPAAVPLLLATVRAVRTRG